MATYALLLNHAPDRYDGLTEDDFMAVIKDYIAWVEDMSAKGIYKGGHKLSTVPGKIMDSTGGDIDVHDAPFAEMTEVLGGLMLIEAASLDEATDIARTCPHLVHNTRLEIREVDDVD